VCRDKELWEVSDGGVYLLRELCSSEPEFALSMVSHLADLAAMRHFEHSHKLRETIWNCVPTIAARLGKAPFKACLELLLEPMFNDLRCGNALCECAAGKCVAALRAWLGASIFAGRLEDWQRRELETNPNVPANVVWENHMQEASQGPHVERSKAPPRESLAERMKGLPPGAPIPNLLAR
jgi:hypothetical protein